MNVKAVGNILGKALLAEAALLLLPLGAAALYREPLSPFLWTIAVLLLAGGGLNAAKPKAAELFAREAPELAGSGFIRTFVGNLTLAEIRMTLPRSFVPQSAVDLFEKMAEMLNRQAAEGGKS